MINSKKIIASVVAGLMCVNICTVNAYALNQEKKVLTMENTSKGIKQISINYGSEYNNSEFKVNYLKATKVNDGVEFELSYESPEDSEFSFFNPPNGDKLMKRFYGGIKKGKNTAKFKLTQKEFKQALQDDSITMCFGFDNNLGWIFFDENELQKIDSDVSEDNKDDNNNPGDNNNKDKEENLEKTNLNFNKRYVNKNFKIDSLKARRTNEGVEFQLSYVSPEDCDFSFFNPPNGDKLMKRFYGGIKKGKNTAEFKLTQKEFKQALQDDNITMCFGFDNNLGWIFIDKDELEKIDSDISEDNKDDNNNPGDNGNKDDNDNNAGDNNNKGEEENLEKTNLNFDERYGNKKFKVNSLKATKLSDGAEFELSYVSPEDCDFSFFNPPKGDKLMKVINAGIKEGKNVTKFKLTQEECKKALEDESITMKFGFDNTLGWIFIEKDQLKFLISNNNETVKKTGWISVENKEHKKNWYYIFEDGTKAYGWQLINGAWYYFDSNNDGLMIENQFIDSNSDKYYLDENGSMIMNKWLDTDNGWVYFQHNGSSARQWAYINGVWYYFDFNGIMLKGWNYINGTWYYFYGSGAMAVNVVIDGWKVNGSGVATPF